MKRIQITPEELRLKIEEHFKKAGLKAELYIAASAESGSKTQSVRFKGVFNGGRILEIDIYFNGHYKPILTDFKGVCPICELANILTEFKNVIDNL